jgi:penicillin-binding protein 1C
VTVRRALQLSLNAPAVSVLEAVGPNRFATRIRQAGARLVLPKGDVPGLAVALGGVGIRLADLTMLYAGIARLGTSVALTQLGDASLVEAGRLLDPVAAWYVSSVLLGTPPPENAMKGRLAYKTGTSYGYRDAWAIGFDGKQTIGVWVGRPDGASVPGLVGRSAAAPILFDAFARTDRPFVPLSAAPNGTVLAPNPKLPPPLRRFRPHELGTEPGALPPRITFPPNGARLERAAAPAGGSEPLPLTVSGGVLPVTVLVNGVPIGSTRGRPTMLWEPDGPGFVRLTVMDAHGATDSVMVRVQ